jgi:hypothetical protein
MTLRPRPSGDPTAQLVAQSKADWDEWVQALTPRSQQIVGQIPVQAMPTEGPSWQVLLVPEMAEAELTVFHSVEDVSAFLQTHLEEKGLKVFVFFGWRARISKRPHRYLIHPNGATFPLFDLPATVEVDEDDMLGPDPDAEVTSTIGDDYQDEAEEPEEDSWAEHQEAEEDEEEEEDDEEDDDIEVED